MSAEQVTANGVHGAANAQREYRVGRQDLPLSCPLPSMTLWNSHPRVYLPIEKTGRAKCPYCGASFVLLEDATGAAPDV